MTNNEAIKRISDFGLFHAIEDLPNSHFTVIAFKMAIKALYENDKLKAKIERLTIERDSAIALHKDCSSELNMRMKEIEQLKAELEQRNNKIKEKIIDRRWEFTNDTEPIEAMCMQWANRMNNWCIEIIEEAEQALKVDISKAENNTMSCLNCKVITNDLSQETCNRCENYNKWVKGGTE